MMRRLITLLVLFLGIASLSFAQEPSRAERSAEVLRRLKASRPPVTITETSHPAGLRHVVIVRVTTPPTPVQVRVIPRRLDGTRVTDPPMVFGFTPHDWQWWYQFRIHR